MGPIVRPLPRRLPGGACDRRAGRARPAADRRRSADPHERASRGDPVHAARLRQRAVARIAGYISGFGARSGGLRRRRHLPFARAIGRAADAVPETRVRHAHAMPFGAEVRADGRVRFRLWAPAATQVQLVLCAPDDRVPSERLPMQRCEDGFHELVTAQARAGSRYRFRIDERIEVPDPASRANPDDVRGASEVIDAHAFAWDDAEWPGRPWHEAVIYELHIGTFTPGGSFLSASERVPYLAALGVTAVELMPIADFPGARNWGYDGVLPFAPDARYGTPDDLKHLVQAAHPHGLMIFLDVVYNHFGPEGNLLHAYAPAFFSDRYKTLWRQAINFDGDGSRQVREVFIHNTLYS